MRKDSHSRNTNKVVITQDLAYLHTSTYQKNTTSSKNTLETKIAPCHWKWVSGPNLPLTQGTLVSVAGLSARSLCFINKKTQVASEAPLLTPW